MQPQLKSSLNAMLLCAALIASWVVLRGAL